MLNMISRFVGFFFIFGVSRKIESFGWNTQGAAFVDLSVGLAVSICIFYLIAITILTVLNKKTTLTRKNLPEIMNLLVSVIVIYSASQMATNLFNVEFTTAYQLMFFGRCLCAFTEKSN